MKPKASNHELERPSTESKVITPGIAHGTGTQYSLNDTGSKEKTKKPANQKNEKKVEKSKSKSVLKYSKLKSDGAGEQNKGEHFDFTNFSPTMQFTGRNNLLNTLPNSNTLINESEEHESKAMYHDHLDDQFVKEKIDQIMSQKQKTRVDSRSTQ